MSKARRWLYSFMASGVFLHLGCSSPRSQPQDEKPGEPPATIEVTAQELVAGLASGSMRERTRVRGFRITRHPITRGDYQACVDAGVCQEPDPLRVKNAKKAAAFGKSKNSPATCVGVEGAATFCNWLGGELPTLSQWLLAARGPDVRRFAWGENVPTCTQHPLAEQVHSRVAAAKALLVEDASDATEKACDKRSLDDVVVARHADGHAPSGVEDVLVTYSELVRSSDDALFPACGEAFEGCVVFGSVPGAIDAVAPMVEVREVADAVEYLPHVTRDAGFRCVWGK